MVDKRHDSIYTGLPDSMAGFGAVLPLLVMSVTAIITLGKSFLQIKLYLMLALSFFIVMN